MDLPIDAAGLQAHAAVLRATAEDVSGVADRLGTRVAVMDFRGPAAERFRAQMSDREVRLRRIAQELRDVGDMVQAGASS